VQVLADERNCAASQPGKVRLTGRSAITAKIAVLENQRSGSLVPTCKLALVFENPYLLGSNKLRSVTGMKPNRIFLLLAASFFALLSAGQLAAQSAAPVTLVKAGRLLDPRTGNVLSPAAVLIEDGKIKEVGAPSRVQADAPAGVKTIDLASATLLPGLIDSHTHLLLNMIVPTEAEIDRYGAFVPGLLLAVAAKSPAERVLLGAQRPGEWFHHRAQCRALRH
jgi:hypothetical protein